MRNAPLAAIAQATRAGRWLVAGLALAAAAACQLQPRAQPAPRPFFFIQLSDPQFGFFTANADFARETANFTRAIAIANQLRPAFVVVTGDLVHRVGDSAQVAEYWRIAKQLDPSIPLYNVAGNHDVGQVPTPALLASYRARFGPDWYLFERNGMVGVVLNSSLYKDPSGAPADAAAQDRWLRASLDSLRLAGHTNIVMFQHHPWFLADPDEPDQYYNLPIERRRDALTLFRVHGVSRVFAGHYHRNAFGRSGELEMVTSGPVGRPMGADSSGLRIVTVDGTDIRHRYYALDSVPGVVAMPRVVPAGSPDARGAGSAIRVMTYNIAAGRGNLDAIAQVIRSADADLVALQEVDVHWGARSRFADQARWLAERLGMDARFAPIYRLPAADAAGPPREYGVALLSRFPVASFRNDTIMRLSTQDSTRGPAPAPGFLNATVRVGGQEIRVFNTHTDFRPDPAVRRAQVAGMLAIIGTPAMPTLLLGDLNAPPTAPELRPLLERLRDAWPPDSGNGFTYPASAPARRIDYVLASPHFRVVSARVLPDTASDHRGVVVDLVRGAARPAARP